MNDSYFIGYRERKPSEYRRATRGFAYGVGLALILLAAVLTASQQFAESRFEFGTFEAYEGVALLEPLPHLRLADGTRFALTVPGKSGAEGALEHLVGRRVRLLGQRIERNGITMLELDPGSIVAGDSTGPDSAWQPVHRTSIELTGELVGAKCYLGVMNPGQGKTHEACARHCILGGVPAMLHVRSHDGGERGIYLSGIDRNALVALAGQHVTVQGALTSEGGMPVLEGEHLELALH